MRVFAFISAVFFSLSAWSFKQGDIAVESFSEFSGLWKLTEESLSHRESFDPRCNPWTRSRIFRVNVNLIKENAKFYSEGDITVTLEQLWSVDDNSWGRAFDRAPFLFNIYGKEFGEVGGHRYFYKTRLKNSTFIVDETAVKQLLKVEEIEGSKYLVYEYDYSEGDGFSTKCVFQKVTE